MNQPQKTGAIARQPAPIQRRFVDIEGQRHEVHLVPVDNTQPLYVQQHTDPRPSHYQTMATRGNQPQTFKAPSMPTALQLTSAAVVAICFLVAASMFSIALTSYSNSVDRVDNYRTPDNSFLEVR